MDALGERWSTPKGIVSDLALVAMMTYPIWRFGQASLTESVLRAIVLLVLLHLLVRATLVMVRRIAGVDTEGSTRLEAQEGEETSEESDVNRR